MNNRTANISRSTEETTIKLQLDLDGAGQSAISTGLGFLDHMLGALALHAQINLSLSCTGDLDVDDHHTVEDCAITLGQALDVALADKRGIKRFSSAYAPLDESLARAVIDLSGRPCANVDLQFVRDSIGPLACENLTHFFVSFAMAAKLTLHIDLIRGQNDHHKAEAAFKALALALRSAIAFDPASDALPSTKGVL